MVGFPWGRASDPAGVAPGPLEEFFDSFEGYVTWSVKTLSMSIMKIGLFCAGVATYSQWSERRLPETELQAGNPSENPCPVRGGRL